MSLHADNIGVAHQSVLVLGLGVSGEAAAVLLRDEGSTVVVLDSKTSPSFVARKTRLEEMGVAVELGATTLPETCFDLCVVSPGIHATSEWMVEVQRRGIPVLSELALGASRCRCPLLAITGTNGKTTMVTYCTQILQHAGVRAEMAGNCGVPLCGLAAQSQSLDWIVVEVSSFQMEWPGDFHPRVAVLLNIQPDHLDRHGSMEGYTETKSRMFRKMDGSDVAIVPLEVSEEVRSASQSQAAWVTVSDSSGADYTYSDQQVAVGKTGVSHSFEGTMFANPILGRAAAFALAAMQACKVPAHHVVSVARSFRALPHRMQHVACIDGVEFVNDSKATNIAALCAGVEMTAGPVRLIAGGLLKEKNVLIAKELLARKACSVYLIGNASDVLSDAWSEAVTCVRCETLECALDRAVKEASAGETVLLSPGCASFDQFTNFEQRGEKFIERVRTYHEKSRGR